MRQQFVDNEIFNRIESAPNLVFRFDMGLPEWIMETILRMTQSAIKILRYIEGKGRSVA